MEDKKTYWTKLRTNLTIGTTAVILISVVVLFFVKAENTKKDNEVTHENIEQRISPTVSKFNKIVDHVDEVPSDIENYQREERLIEQGDITIEQQLVNYDQQIKIDSQQVELNTNLKIFYEFQKQIKVDDSLTEITKQISRDQRGDDLKLLLNNSINTTNAINAINQRLDTIN